MSKKCNIILIISFIFILFGSLWFLTDDINGILTSFDPNHYDTLEHKVRDIVKISRTGVYIVLLIVSFIGILKQKKQHILYFITFIFLSFYTICWIPEFFEYIVNVLQDGNYAMTHFFGFMFTIIGDILLIVTYRESNLNFKLN